MATPSLANCKLELLSLPPEILCMLPNFIDNIETFTNASSSCRTLYDAFKGTHPETILRLAAGSGQTLFQPHPTFLVTITARSASDWALTQPDGDELLRNAFSGGMRTLYKFCLAHGTLTLDQIRKTYQQRFSIINRLSRLVQSFAWEWKSKPGYFEDINYGDAEDNGDASDRQPTIWGRTALPAFQLIIYGELFARTMDAFLADPEWKSLPRFSDRTRMEYFYTLPTKNGGWNEDYVLYLSRFVQSTRAWGRKWVSAIRRFVDAGYVSGIRYLDRDVMYYSDYSEPYGSHEDGRDPSNGGLLMSALQMQGLDGMELITRKHDEQLSVQYLERARKIREQIEGSERLSNIANGSYDLSEMPDLEYEVQLAAEEFNDSP